MSDKMKKEIRFIGGIVLSVLLIVTGVLFSVACVSIYNIGNRPFTPENISAAFSKIAPFTYITLTAVLAGVIWTIIFPDEEGKPRSIKDKSLTLTMLAQRLNTDLADKDILANIEKEKKLCQTVNLGTATLSLISALPAIIYALNLSNFGADYNSAVIAACAWLLPCTFIVMGICIARGYIVNASVERQIALVKSAIAKAGAITPSEQKTRKTDERIVLGIRVAIAAVALVFIVIGIFNGGMADVLYKAINICTECIGLG